MLDQVDEDVLQARLGGVEILEPDAELGELAQQRRDAGAFGLGIESVAQAMSLILERDMPFVELGGDDGERIDQREDHFALAELLPQLGLFLDEPTAGVDVSLRRDMWKMIGGLRERGTTIILTTHYIEEAEEMADRVGVINKGQLLLVEEKAALMKKLGKREMDISLSEPMAAIPVALDEWHLSLEDEGHRLRYTFDAQAERTGIPSLLRKLAELDIGFKDLDTSKSSLEDIFVDLVERPTQSGEGVAA